MVASYDGKDIEQEIEITVTLLNQIPVGALTNKAGTKYIVTVSGKYLTIKA